MFRVREYAGDMIIKQVIAILENFMFLLCFVVCFFLLSFFICEQEISGNDDEPRIYLTAACKITT